MKTIREYPHIFSLLTVFLWTMVVIAIIYFFVAPLSWWHYLLLGLLVGLTFDFGEYFGKIKYQYNQRKKGIVYRQRGGG